ncbi:MAG: inositol monophosphatase family protein [Mariniblastus sp.]
MELEARLSFANQIAKAAGKRTLKYFQTALFDVQKKEDGSPLTIADQDAERYLRKMIQEHYPSDSIIGEEFESVEGSSPYRWILDPIDGTKSFISGVPLYGTMVAVEQIESDSKIRNSVIGSVYLPGLDVGVYAAQGLGAWAFQGDQPVVRAKVSKKSELEDSVLTTSSIDSFGARGAGDAYQALSSSVYFCRTWGDVYGYFLVATGRVEVMIDPELNIWDAAAVQPIIEEAGGKFTDWQGDQRIDSGDAVGSNGLIHEAVLKKLGAGI